ncbi:hypothetical protein [Erwinia psidii]|uniref:Uncharacterized protein n=1 Tax=Erwinia psidii TaxID=69224 RepID=A0A3N6TQS4_9GAMM|nr:hypothetical protein [Erwinia psidii]MCX8955760.1 hypothetical protein [Erwinia psidii]MCX8961682.1 hypothetical protein [Erwinia psidii]MCX8965784.1 hypothetical protein [Erwinia psidii]RQM37602.1 hypothetical protein EB241_13740 [Erwinia psidii]
MIKKLSVALLLTLCVSTTVFAGSDKETDARRNTLTGADSYGQYHQFSNQLQKAVKEKDKKTVAAMVDYPITVIVSYKETDIADSHFVKAYDSVFTDRLVNIILHQTYADLFVNSTGVMIGP